MGARDAFYYGAFLFAVHREVSAQDMTLLVPVNHHLVFMLGHDGLLVVCVAGICPYHRRTVGQLVLVAPMEHAVVGSHGAVRLAQTVKPASLLRGCGYMGRVRGGFRVHVKGRRKGCGRAVKAVFHVSMRRGPVRIAPAFRAFLGLAAETVLAAGFYLTLQFRYLPVLFP